MSYTQGKWTPVEHGLRNIEGEIHADWTHEDVVRACDCVNACAGIEDPAKAISTAIVALENASALCSALGHNNTGDAVNAALRLLVPKRELRHA